MKTRGPILSGLFFLILIFSLISCGRCCMGCMRGDPIYSAGYTRIKNNTNNLISLYFNDIFLDILKPQHSIKYEFITGATSFTLVIKKENNTYILINDTRFITGNMLGTVNTPIYFKGLVNDSVKYRYDLQPLHINKLTPDSIIIFEDMENK